MRFRDYSIKNKLLIVGISLPTALLVILFFMYFGQVRQSTVDGYVEKARAICLTTESVREQMEISWKKGLHTVEQLRIWAEQGEQDKVLAAVPVVMAWRSAMQKAEEGGYAFSTPKFKPRNPANEPDALETRALRTMENQRLNEYYEIDRSINSVRYFRPVRLSEACLYCHGEPHLSREFWGNDQGLDPTGARMEGWRVGEIHGAFQVVQSLDAADQQLRRSLLVAGLVVLLGLALLAFVFVRFAGSISKPLKQSVGMIQRMAKGDMTVHLDIQQQDEVGALGAAMNSMAADLRETVQKLTINAANLTEASGSLSHISNDMAVGAEEMSTQSRTVAAAGEELSVIIQNMAHTAEEVSDSATSVAGAIEQMSASVADVAANCDKESQIAQKATQQAHQTREIMTRLGDSAREISQISEVIRGIADQTNLLALNATIEAANAGDAGKGFAVVANEVKELARLSAESTEQIASQIETMQKNTRISIKAIEDITSIIEEVSNIANSIAASVEEQSKVTSEIARTVSSVSSASQALTVNVQESSQGANDVSSNIQGVSEAARMTAEGAVRTSDNARQLSGMAAELKSIVERFKI